MAKYLIECIRLVALISINCTFRTILEMTGKEQ